MRFRPSVIAGLFLSVLVVLAPRGARSEQLQRLHIASFTLAVAGAPFKVEQPLRLVVNLHAREHVTDLPNLVLPPLANLDVLGDEKHVVSTPAGTDYTEYVTLVAHAPGAFAIAPAYLDAIDARDGKPKRFLSNSLTLRVPWERLAPTNGNVSFWAGLRTALLFAAPVAGILVIVGLALMVLTLRHPPPTIAPSVAREVEVPPQSQRSLQSVLAAALDELRARPTRATALAVRVQLWTFLGVDEGATLSDVLRRPQAHDEHVRVILCATERAAFTYDADLSFAIAAAIGVMEKQPKK